MHRSLVYRVVNSRRLRWSGHVARMEEGSAFKILTDKPTGKRSLWKHRYRWDDNVRIDHVILGVNAMNWNDSGHDRDY